MSNGEAIICAFRRMLVRKCSLKSSQDKKEVSVIHMSGWYGIKTHAVDPVLSLTAKIRGKISSTAISKPHEYQTLDLLIYSIH